MENLIDESIRKKRADCIKQEICEKSGRIADCIVNNKSVKIYPSKDGIKVTVNHENVLK